MSNELKTPWTPSPWRLDDASADLAGLIKEDYHTIDAGKGFYDTSNTSGFGLTGLLSPADARLIAAAPELVELLAGVRDDLCQISESPYIQKQIERIDALLARIRGEA